VLLRGFFGMCGWGEILHFFLYKIDEGD